MFAVQTGSSGVGVLVLIVLIAAGALLRRRRRVPMTREEREMSELRKDVARLKRQEKLRQWD